MNGLFFHIYIYIYIGNFIIPTDFHFHSIIFQRGGEKPPTSMFMEGISAVDWDDDLKRPTIFRT